MITSKVTNLTAALESITEPWKPHRLVSLNDSDMKVAELLGEFVWHSHPSSDELVLVVSGSLTLRGRGSLGRDLRA